MAEQSVELGNQPGARSGRTIMCHRCAMCGVLVGKHSGIAGLTYFINGGHGLGSAPHSYRLRCLAICITPICT